MNVNDECILGALLSWTELEELVRGFLKTEARFGDGKKLEKLGVNQGFLSVVARLTPDWRDDSSELPATLVVKVPTSETMLEMAKQIELADGVKQIREFLEDVEFHRGMDRAVRKLHNNECDFYEFVASKGLATSIAVPRVFGFRRFSKEHRQGIIVMEDLSDVGRVTSLWENLSVDDAKQVIDGIIPLHSFFLENPDIEESGKFDAPLSTAYRQQNLKVGGPILASYRFQMVKGMVESVKLTLRKQARLIDDLLYVFDSLVDLRKLKTIPVELGIPNVLIHGDLWISNILWRHDGIGRRQLVAVLDWQVAHFGCITEDLIRFLALGLSGEARRTHWSHLLSYYCHRLEENMGRSPPFSLQQLEESYRRMFSIAGVLLLAAGGPVTHTVISEKSTSEEEAKCFRALVEEKIIALLEDVVEGVPHALRTDAPII